MKKIKYARSLLKKLFFSLVLLNRSEHSPFGGKKKVLIRKSFLFMEGFGDPSWDNCQSFSFLRRALVFQNLLVVTMSIKGSIQKAARTRNASFLMHDRADFDIRVSYFGDVN